VDKIDLALLHGGGQGSWVWQETIAALHSQCTDLFRRIVALDIPGCGTKRGRATQQLEPQDVARELIADLESAGTRQCVLAGHSLAGNVLPAMAELRPNLFRRLIYVSCSIPSNGQTVLELLGSRLHGSSEDEVGWPVDPKNTNVRDRYDAMFCEDMSETQRTTFLEQLGRDEWPQKFFSATRFTVDTLSSIPATYVVCLKDRSLPVAWQEKFAARFHAQRLVRIDAGHQVMITRPHTLAEVLRHEVLV
jgi:pimeloyl-ACP methyl ester carboxylesterase